MLGSRTSSPQRGSIRPELPAPRMDRFPSIPFRIQRPSALERRSRDPSPTSPSPSREARAPSSRPDGRTLRMRTHATGRRGSFPRRRRIGGISGLASTSSPVLPAIRYQPLPLCIRPSPRKLRTMRPTSLDSARLFAAHVSRAFSGCPGPKPSSFSAPAPP